jgi:hypothetical protein
MKFFVESRFQQKVIKINHSDHCKSMNKLHQLVKLIAILLTTLATEANSGPNQMDILGLVPGVSDLQQVKAASVNPNTTSKESFRMEIGGHVMPCAVSFLDEKLSDLSCFTGKGTGKYETYTEASNTLVHAELVLGFTKKFGKPDSVSNEAVRTRAGVEYTNNKVVWIDKQGNKLMLISLFGTVSEGVISFESLASIRKREAESAEQEKKKKF